MTQGGAARFSLLIFCQQLLSLLEAGLQLVEAVDTLASQEQMSQQHSILVELQSSLRSGLSFSQALAQWPAVFPALLQTTIEASEQTGGVAQALKRFVAYETRFQTLRSKLVGALIYPALLLSLGGLVIAFLLGYVVPRFSVVFIDRLDTMPYLSSLVIRLGLSISDNPITALVLAGGTLAGVGGLFALPATRAWLASMAWQLPWLGERIHQFELVRMYRALGMLLRGGIPAVQSLELVAAMTPLHAQAAMQSTIASVTQGQPLSNALQQAGFTTVVSERLLRVGERSGQMGDMLEHAADFMDAELERAVERATRLLEPLMMMVIGVLIGGIVMLMYLPIFELADSVG